jgi:ParB/RepB/Spo0J family partition protein
MSTKQNKKSKLDTVGLMRLAVNDIIPDPDQPRKRFKTDTLEELGHSLVETGQVSPIIIRPGPGNKYVIVTGERRWRAAKEAGISYVECIVRRDIDNQKALELQLAENCQREDLTPLEQARAFKAYIDKYKVSQSELSRRTGIPQRTISARLALLLLPASMHAKIEAGEIGPHQALQLAKRDADTHEPKAKAAAPNIVDIEKRWGDADDRLVKWFELLEQIAKWLDLLIVACGFADGTRKVPCIFCTRSGKKNCLMEMKDDRFECPRCGEFLYIPFGISWRATVGVVVEWVVRGYEPPERSKNAK